MDQSGDVSVTPTGVSSPDILSPGGKSRYGRTRRPKIARDFCNIDDVVIDENPSARASPIKSPKLKPPPKSPIIDEELVYELTKIDDLGMKVANNFKTNPQRGLDDTIKERKFFKRLPESKVEVPNVPDVNKVFKLISTKSLDIQEMKTPHKTTLKTYSNKRKHLNDSDNFIVESFGLPDEPIIPASSPFTIERDTTIDIDMSCAVDVNLPVSWSFDDYPLPLFASEPTGYLELFPYDTLLRETMSFDSCQENENMAKMRNTPVVPTCEESAKVVSEVPVKNSESVNGKKKRPLMSSPETQKVDRVSKKKKTLKSPETPARKPIRNFPKAEVKRTLRSSLEPVKPLETAKEARKESSDKIKISRTLRSSLEPEKALESVQENISRTLRSSLDPVNPLESARESIQDDNPEDPSEMKKKRTLRSCLEPLEAKDNVQDVKLKEVKESVQQVSNADIPKEVDTVKKTVRKSVEADASKSESAGVEVVKKRTLRSFLDPVRSPTQTAEVKRTLRSSLEMGTVATNDNTNENDSSLLSDDFPLSLYVEKSEKSRKPEDKKVSPKKKMKNEACSPKRLRSSISNSELKETPTSSTNQKTAKIPANPTVKSKSQVINPVNVSKKICSPHIKVVLNPLSCLNYLEGNKNLVPNPFKIKKNGNKPKLKQKLNFKDDETLSYAIVGNNRKALRKKELKHHKSEQVQMKLDELDIKNIKTELIEFQVGDLAWAKIGTHPYWPCMVTQEPMSGDHKKFVINRTQPLYHVRFFGDKGRRSWVTAQYVMLFYGRDDLEKLVKVLKAEDKVKASFLKSYQVRGVKLPKWQAGVQEAESLKTKPMEDRLNYFFDVFASKQEKRERLQELGVEEVKSDAGKSKRTSESEHPSKRIKRELLEEKTTDPDSSAEASPRKAQKKRSNASPDKTVKKSEKSPLKSQNKEEPQLFKSPEAPKKPAKRNQSLDENDVPSPDKQKKPVEKPSRKSQGEDADVKAQTDNKTVPERRKSQSAKDTPDGRKVRQKSLPEETEESLEARKKLRNSQPDAKPKRSSTEEPQPEHEEGEEETVPKLRNKRHQIPAAGEYSNSDTDSKFSDNSSVPTSLESQAALYRRNNIFRGIPKDKVCQVCETSGEVFKCKGPCSGVYHYDCALPPAKEKAEENVQPDEQSNVEIVSVNSKKPLPNLSDSPNYKGMTLAEKIDFRMKEIMKKFDYQTVYAESTDSSSEEVVVDESAKKPNTLSLTVTNRPSKKEVPIIKHVTADNISYICVTNERPKDKELSSIIRNTLKCNWCLSEVTPQCLICHKDESKSGAEFRQKCSLHQCGKFYHPECLKVWPQTQWSLIQSTKDKHSDAKYDTFVCPRHVCHTCISDDPRAANSRCPSDKVVKCLKCPATYHSSNYCVPAGTEILSSSQIVCPRHYSRHKSGKRRMQQTINTNWCFICSKGGNLICCETCPTSVHVECLPGDLNEDDTFFCEDCQSGRLPLYDEIVWVKLGTFRWWPALILFPNEVPDNVRNIAHNKGEFVVKFFGTYDHYWVGRGRTFLFQEGDKGHSSSVRKRVDNAFVKAIEEAAAAHVLKKQFKVNKVAEKNSGLKPPPYIRIKVNKPVGNVRLGDGNTSNTTSCDCDPNQPHPCGPESDCLNRLLLTECNPEVCPAGDRCNNQCFEKREYPPLVPHRTQVRGWGLKTLAPIRKGQFVIEYVGEIIDEQEYQRRIQKMHEQKEENYYFLTIDKDRTLDAGPKGNVARFMNHSCLPNCETQKWTVNGDTRVGLFAKCDIAADTELTFNYNLECIGKEKKMCKCGAPNCSGFIGVKVKPEAPPRKSTKPRKKKSPQREVVNNENPCFVCGKVGDVNACNNKICTKYYHLGCVGLAVWPEGNKWVCQWHNCNICSKRTIRCCVKCVNSYCPPHSEGYVRYDKLLGFVCFEHDPTKEKNTIVTKVGAETEANTAEGAVTSTTPDEVERKKPEGDEDLDCLNLKARLNGCVTSTPLKEESSSRDESTVSSAGTSNESKKKRRSRKKKKAVKKKIQVQVKTANLFNTMQNEVKLSKFTPVKYLRTSRNSTKVLNRTDPDRDLPIRKRTRLRCGDTL